MLNFVEHVEIYGPNTTLIFVEQHAIIATLYYKMPNSDILEGLGMAGFVCLV
jgi:hypothetical protein